MKVDILVFFQISEEKLPPFSNQNDVGCGSVINIYYVEAIILLYVICSEFLSWRDGEFY
jgi:hypothetical protein